MITRNKEKLATLLYLITEIISKDDSNIIFAATKYHVDLISLVFTSFNIHNVGIYGSMDMGIRKDMIMEFKKNNNCKTMVVTDLAARGIDLPFVNNIIHFDFPSQAKTFIHRSGRTARAGRDVKFN